MYLRTRKSPLVLELVRILTPDMDRIRFGGRLSSPSVLIIVVLARSYVSSCYLAIYLLLNACQTSANNINCLFQADHPRLCAFSYACSLPVT